MMTRRETFLLCGMTLSLGMVIGLLCDSWRVTAEVQANALDRSAANRLY